VTTGERRSGAGDAPTPATAPEGATVEQAALRLGELASARGVWVALAESLTGGSAVAALARTEGSSEWLRGGIVSYDREVKYQLLDVPVGPVVSRAAAAAMAASARLLLRADLAASVTGAGGPEGQDGEPAGSVWIAAAGSGPVVTEHHQFSGDPDAVCAQAAVAMLELCHRQLVQGHHLRLGPAASPSDAR
jgi:nicotinamide-nucleotide amidase